MTKERRNKDQEASPYGAPNFASQVRFLTIEELVKQGPFKLRVHGQEPFEFEVNLEGMNLTTEEEALFALTKDENGKYIIVSQNGQKL